MVFARGSEWRKWDLHIHTPKSIVNRYGGDDEETWEEFISALENLPKEVKVIGINDYYFIDGYEKVMNYRKNGRLNNIEKIFPVLEFRIDTFANAQRNKFSKINLHILFDLDETNLKNEIKKVKEEFIEVIPVSGLPEYKTKMLSRSNFAECGGDLNKGFSNLVPPTKDVLEVILSNTWKGKTFIFLGWNEWDSLDNGTALNPYKEHLLGQADAFFTAGTSIEAIANHQKKLGTKRLLHSGDIHSFDDLDVEKNYRCYTWIKADPTFEGLRQIKYEPMERVAIQEAMPEAKVRYQIIDRIILSYDAFKEQSIVFNQNLNTIIGGRSTGKSTLLSLIAGAIDKSTVSENEQDNLFIQGLLPGVKIEWKDQQANVSRDIEFLRQGYMHDIALNQEERNNIIEKNIRDTSLWMSIEKYNDKIKNIEREINNKIDMLQDVSNHIAETDNKLKEAGNKSSIEKEITQLEQYMKELHSKQSLTDIQRQMYTENMSKISQMQNENNIIKQDKNIISNLKNIHLVNQNIVYQFSALEKTRKEKLGKIFQTLASEVDEKWKSMIALELEQLLKKEQENENEINVIVNSSEYKNAQQVLQNDVAYKGLSDKLQIEKTKLMDITHIEEEKETFVKQQKELVSTIVTLHKSFYSAFNELHDENHLNANGIQIDVGRCDNTERIADLFEELYRQGDKKVKTQKEDFIKKYNKHVNENTLDELDDIIRSYLIGEFTQGFTLRNNHTSTEALKALFSHCWFDLKYDIRYEDESFEDMSQGKKAFVILKLLLEYSKKMCPILIDQPEDSLDNRAIYTELVQYLKEKKKTRQIILVTHNPNIVVGADAEEVIVANQNGKDSPNTEGVRFKYCTGALENTLQRDFHSEVTDILDSQGIREHVCEILEGGMEAFQKREQKYSIITPVERILQ